MSHTPSTQHGAETLPCAAPAAVRRLSALGLGSARLIAEASQRAASCPHCIAAHATASTPFERQGVAFPSPFHSHAFAASRTGANAYSSGALKADPTAIASPTSSTRGLESPRSEHRSTLTNGSSVSIGGSDSSRSHSTHTPFPSTTPASAFLSRNKNARDGDDASPSTKTDAHSGASPTIPNDDQLILSDGTEELKEQGSEAFLAGLDQAISAHQAVRDQMGTAEAMPEARSANCSAVGTKWSLTTMLKHNHQFVQGKSYVPYMTEKFPYKKLVIVSCMDTRLTQLLPMALDLKNGDAKIIKVAGAMVAHPFGSVMRSILVAVYGLGAEHILVVGHHDCGMTGLDPSKILLQAKQRGIPDATFKTLSSAGLNLESWLSGFKSVESSVRHSVETIRNHPLLNFQETHVKASQLALSGAVHALPLGGSSSVAKTRLPKITVTGLVICPKTGKLDLLTETDPETQALVDRQNAELAAQAREEINAQGSSAEGVRQQQQDSGMAAVACS